MNERYPQSSNRVLDLQKRYLLPDECIFKLKKLLEHLQADRYASTSVKKGELAVDTHVADSLAALKVDELRNASTVIDIGSGAGFPGLPLAIAIPEARFELLEASERKLGFARRFLEALKLENVELIAERAELWAASDGACRYQAALTRAVSKLPTVLEYAAPLLVEGGIFIVWKGKRSTEEEIQAVRAAEMLGMELERVLSVEPSPGSRNRHLHLYRKVRKTPDRYPRRAGMAKKKPL